MDYLTSCLARIQEQAIPTLSAALAAAGYPDPKITQRVSVTELGYARPRILVLDLDLLNGDSFETLRQLRFVLPHCTIAIFTEIFTREWGAKCHLAGANCLLAKSSDESVFTEGLKHALDFGCYTDPAFTDGSSRDKDQKTRG